MSTNYPYGYYYGPPQPPVPPEPPHSSRRRDVKAVLTGFAAGVVAAGLVVGGVAAANSGSSVSGAGRVSALPSLPGGLGSGGSGSGGLGSGSGGTIPGLPGGMPNIVIPGGGSTQSGTHLKQASATQQLGIVTVNSVLKYQNAESAGTGMILTSNGEVLTNNHVVNGATSVVVTVESTGRSYKASVVGTAPTRDVALLKLANASGLQTAHLASSASGLSVGSKVTGVGNAGGTGRLTQASGAVTGLDKTITASDDTGADSERLHGLIESNAGIISGDSGGPLYNSQGQVVGMDTAASPNSAQQDAYAIPIQNAMSVVRQIESGVETSSIHIGLPGFLGINVGKSSGRGVGVAALLRGGPAASAGITAGSVIESVDGTKVHSETALHDLLSAKGPGAQVQIVWLDRHGRSHTATVTLATGPAD